jgi:glyoxalase family protein
MALEGLHHITAITADAPGNVEFYGRVLGLRMVKKTVNFDQPDVYHLYYADERGTPGSILTFFEFPDAARGAPGDGMVHTIRWRVAGDAALQFWERRLDAAGVASGRSESALRFTDPEGLAHELVAADVEDRPLVAQAADVPAEHAIQGFHGVRAFASTPQRSAPLLRAMGFEPVDAPGTVAGGRRDDAQAAGGAAAGRTDDAQAAGGAAAGRTDDAQAAGGAAAWRVGDAERHAFLHYDAPPEQIGRQGAGSVHHIAWSAADDGELTLFREAAIGAGARPTPIIDRQYFHSVYFREPSHILFELASRDIGFDYDEPLEHLGEALKLPPRYEAARAELERRLTPLINPRETVAS